MRFEEYKKLSPDQRVEVERTAAPDAVETFQRMRERLQQEVEESVQEFINEDTKLENAISESGLDDTIVEEVKNELGVTENLQSLNHEAEMLAVSVQEELARKNSSENEDKDIALQKSTKHEALLRDINEEKKLLDVKSVEMSREAFAIQKKYLQLKEFRARAQFQSNTRGEKLLAQDESSKDSQSKTERSIAAETAIERAARKKTEQLVQDINALIELILAKGYEPSRVSSLEYSDDPQEQEDAQNFAVHFKEIGSQLETVTTTHPRYLLDVLHMIKDPNIRTSILDSLIDDTNLSTPLLVVKVSELVKSGNVNESVCSGLDRRITREIQEELKGLSTEEVIQAWEDNPEYYDSSATDHYRAKFGETFDALIAEQNIDSALDLYERLDSLEKNAGQLYARGYLPEWLRNFSKETVIKTLRKELTDEEFGYYFDLRQNIPWSLVPDTFKARYVKTVFSNGNYIEQGGLENFYTYTKSTFEDLSLQQQAQVLIALGPDSPSSPVSSELCRQMLDQGLIRSVHIPEKFYNALKVDVNSAELLELVEDELNRGDYSFTDKAKLRDELFARLIARRVHGIESIMDQAEKSIEHIKIKRLENIRDAFSALESPESLPEAIKKAYERFKEQYGRKGETLIALALVGQGIENPESFARRMESLETIIDQYNHDAIPEGAHTSIGIEYEVTYSLTNSYNNLSALDYKKDIELISRAAHIGKGLDAVHEIATKPTYNPYILLAEMKLLQEAGMLDLNFGLYPNAARGYHLSMVGERGLRVGGDMYFLNNVLTMAQLAGVTAGKEVRSTKDIHGKNFEHFDIPQHGERCEMKGMACDSIEQFEKAVLLSHFSGIAMQVCNKYLTESLHSPDIVESPEVFESALIEAGYLTEPFGTMQERDIAYQWVLFKKSMVDAVEQHTQSFFDTEAEGYFFSKDEEYIDTSEYINVMRNKQRIDEVGGRESLEKNISLNSQDLFRTQNTEFVNALTRVNNLFLKDMRNEGGTANAQALLGTMRRKGYGEIMDGAPQESIFDRNGSIRDGYYVVQGASEEMIIHKSQILVNNFITNMRALLDPSQISTRNTNQEQLQT